MKKAIFSLCIILFLTSCSTNPFSGPTSTPTLPPTSTSTSTSTPDPTATSTITPSPTPDLPSSWDDPEVIASIRSDFEKVIGMTVENYFNKAVEEARVSRGGSENYMKETESYAIGQLNSLGLGTRIIKSVSRNRRYLVMYIAMSNGDDGVEIYPLDLGFEENGSFVQTNISTVPSNYFELPPLTREDTPLKFSSIEDANSVLNKTSIGIQIHYALVVRFSDLATCDYTQPVLSPSLQFNDVFWNYIREICNTPGNYLNTASQEPKNYQLTLYSERWYSAKSYHPSQLVEKGLPEGGFIVIEIREFIPIE